MHSLKNEDGPVKGTATKRGSDDPRGFEHESFEAQAVLLRMAPHMRERYPEIAREHGYEV